MRAAVNEQLELVADQAGALIRGESGCKVPRERALARAVDSEHGDHESLVPFGSALVPRGRLGAFQGQDALPQRVRDVPATAGRALRRADADVLPDGQGQGRLARHGPLGASQEHRQQGDLGPIRDEPADPAAEASDLARFAARAFRKDDDALARVENGPHLLQCVAACGSAVHPHGTKQEIHHREEPPMAGEVVARGHGVCPKQQTGRQGSAEHERVEVAVVVGGKDERSLRGQVLTAAHIQPKDQVQKRPQHQDVRHEAEQSTQTKGHDSDSARPAS